MNCLYFLITVALLSFQASGFTKIEGKIAEKMFNLMPVVHDTQNLGNIIQIKTMGEDFFCAKRIPKRTISYKCLLPKKNMMGELILNQQVSQQLYDALAQKKSSLMDISVESAKSIQIRKWIKCEKEHYITNTITYSCTVYPD